MDARWQLTRLENQQRRRRRKLLAVEEIVFLTLVMLRGSNEGALPTRRLAFEFYVSWAFVSKHFAHGVRSMHHVVHSTHPIVWRGATARRGMEGLINGFPQAVVLVDGTNVRR